MKKYKVPDQFGFPMEVYLAGDVEEAAIFKDARIGELEQQIEQLQKAVAFWLPHVPPEDTERGQRIGDDTYLLIGYEGEMEADAEERGWIKLTDMPSEGKGESHG